MGDAAGDGRVESGDPEETIDAAPRAESASIRAAPDVSSDASTDRDYGELLAVDRRHYLVAEEIAKGGMGRVIAAHDRRLGRDVAIKELLPKHRDLARRFEREARITARLQHPAIVHVYEAGVWHGGEPFYAMQLVAGRRSLDKVVAACPTLNERLGLLPNVIAVADALAYAHSEHVIHRDLKPSNVLIGEFGETVVIDWGLAKDVAATAANDPAVVDSLPRRVVGDDTIDGSVVGTPAYMPPEQARGESADARSDVYALGALLYTVLAGGAPYTATTTSAVIEQVKAGPPVPVDVREPGTPPDLAAIVAKALARVRSERYASAGELAADLKRFQTGQLVAAHRYTAQQLLWRWLRRRRLAVAIGAAAIVTIAVVAAISVSRIVAEKARAEARRFALLEEQGRSELLDRHPGKALAYLAAAARDGKHDGARAFLIADAMRPFQARVASLANGPLVAVAPNGKDIATAGVGSVVLWSVDGARNATLLVRGRIRALAWAETGARLAAAGDEGTAWVWTWTSDGRVLAELPSRDVIHDVAFDPSGNRLATGNDDGTATVWELSTRSPRRVRCHGGPVVSVRFSREEPSEARVATASEDGTACVFAAATGEKITPLRGHRGPVATARWAHDDHWVVTASDDGTARLWDALRGTLVSEPLGHDAHTTVRLAIVSHDGQYVLTAGGDGVARIWQLPEKDPNEGTVHPARKVATLAGHGGEIVAAAFSEDDSEVATGSVDHFATVWDAERGRALASFEHEEVVDSVAFAEHGTLVTGSRDGSVAIWNADAGALRREVNLDDSSVHAVAVSRDGTLAAGRDDSRVTLVRGTRSNLAPHHLSRVRAVAFAEDGRRLVSAGDDPYWIVWDVASGRLISKVATTDTPVRALAVSGDGKLVATAAGSTVRVWTLDGTLLHTFPSPAGAIGALAFTLDNLHVEGGTDDGAVIAWSLATEWPTLVDELLTPVTALAHSPRDGVLVVAGANLVKIHTRAELISLDNPGKVHGAAFTADGSRLITAGEDGAKIWDATTGVLLGTRDARGAPLEALAIDGDVLWLGGEDGMVRAWDIHLDSHSPDELASFVRKHDPWQLDDHDVLEPSTVSKGNHDQR